MNGPLGAPTPDLVLDYLTAIERDQVWAWLLELDQDEMLEALGEWFLEQESVAPPSREHLALSAALVLFWHQHRSADSA